MILSKICDELEQIAPENTALSFDNVGLLVGDFEKDIKRVLIALDLTNDVLEEAIEMKADLIITHHPLIFNPLKKINTSSVVGQILLKLIKNDICYYASHTNLDKSELGTNTYLAKKLDLENANFVEDEKLILVAGELKTDTNSLISKVKKALDLDYVRFVGDENKQISKVGVATGSGDNYSLFSFCKANGVDVLITGDLTYHTMQFANDIGLNLIDATHFKTESIVTNHLKEILEVKLEKVDIKTSKVEKNIFKTI